MTFSLRWVGDDYVAPSPGDTGGGDPGGGGGGGGGQLDVRAFPGAEGWGADATGGRGGSILFVDNLNDSGAGSFRAAAAASGPRTIVFRTGGTITHSTEVQIGNGDLTIAGQSAPGDGVTLKGAPLIFSASNIICRGIRLRNGTTSLSSGMWDGIAIYGPESSTNFIRDIIIDHCSSSWSIDEALTVYGGVRYVTMSWNIVSEPLNLAQHDAGAHAYGTLLGGSSGGMRQVSFHHNLMAHADQRNPRVQGTQSLEVVSNLFYGWGAWGMQVDKGVIALDPQMNVLSNWWLANAQSNTGRHIRFTDSAWTSSGPAIAYLNDNITPSRTSDAQAQWLAVASNDQGKTWLQAASPFPMSSHPVTVTPRTDLSSLLLPYVGAKRVRDSVDTRIISQVNGGTGTFINSPSDVGGWPSLAAGTYPTDSNGDGIPDAWATANGMGAAAANATNPATGYTWIEDYVNSLL